MGKGKMFCWLLELPVLSLKGSGQFSKDRIFCICDVRHCGDVFELGENVCRIAGNVACVCGVKKLSGGMYCFQVEKGG